MVGAGRGVLEVSGKDVGGVVDPEEPVGIHGATLGLWAAMRDERDE